MFLVKVGAILTTVEFHTPNRFNVTCNHNSVSAYRRVGRSWPGRFRCAGGTPVHGLAGRRGVSIPGIRRCHRLVVKRTMLDALCIRG